VVTPAVAPSGAFVAFSVPISFEPARLSGKSTEMSDDGKPELTNESVAVSTAVRVEYIPNTATFFPVMYFSFEF
jgi:hypothetical protein